GLPCSREYVVEGRGRGGPLVIREREPVYAVVNKSLARLTRRRLVPCAPHVWLERQQRDAHASAREFAEIGKHLRLHERLAQAEVADVESLQRSACFGDAPAANSSPPRCLAPRTARDKRRPTHRRAATAQKCDSRKTHAYSRTAAKR